MRHAGSRFAGAIQTAALFTTVGALLVLSASPASAAQFHPYQYSFDGTGTTAGAFGNLESLTLEQSSGAVYAYDRAKESIDKFDAAGNPQNFSATGTSSLSVPATCPGFSPYVYGEEDIAVDSSETANHGNIYLASYGGGGVCAYNSAGEFLWHMTPEEDPKIGGACGVTTDSLGRLWVASYGNGAMRYTATGSPPTLVAIAGSASSCRFAVGTGGKIYMADVYGRGVERWTVVGFEKKLTENGSAVAFDQTTEHLFVTTYDGVDEYTSEGERISETGRGVPFDQTGVGRLTNASGIAVRASTGQMYVASRGENKIKVYGPLGTFPDVTTGAASNVTRNNVDVSGEVVPAGGNVTNCQVEWGTTVAYGNTTLCEQATPYSGATSVTATLNGLSPGTTYHYRLVAENASGPDWGADREFTTPYVDGVTTEDASGISRSEATLHGSLEPNGIDAHYYFEWGTDTGYGNTSPASPGTDAGTSSGGVPATTTIGGLQYGTTYHYRLVASNAEGVTYGEDMTVKTLEAVLGLETRAASNLSQSTATLNGVLDPAGQPTNYYFEWGPTTSYGNVTSAPPGESAGSTPGPTPVAATISGLENYTTYHYRLVASNGIGTTYGNDEVLVTLPPGLPTISESEAGQITDETAAISAQINPNFGETIYRVQYGRDTEYESRTTAAGPLEADSSNHPINVELTGLTPGATYHYRVVAVNFTGVTHGPDGTFTTQSEPRIESASASSISQTGARIDVRLYPGFSPTTYHVEYGVGGYGSSTPESGAIGSDGAIHAAFVDLAGLSPSTSYHFRIVASNGIGTVASQDQSFTTAPEAVAEEPKPTPAACRKGFVRRHGKCVKRTHHRKRHRHRRRHRAVSKRAGG